MKPLSVAEPDTEESNFQGLSADLQLETGPQILYRGWGLLMSVAHFSTGSYGLSEPDDKVQETRRQGKLPDEQSS